MNFQYYNSRNMIDRRKATQRLILSVLKASDQPLTSPQIVAELVSRGHEISERTVRLYLQEMDGEGLTELVGRRGRRITERGLANIEARRTIERVGFLSAKIDRMTYRMDFDLTSRSGTVVVNVTLVELKEFAKRIKLISKVYEHGYAMGHLMGLLESGERIGQTTIPPGMIGVCTVCSITLNGVLLKHGIPTNSRFGGLLQLEDGEPTTFVEIITYEGTSIDPLEVFIRSGMTDYIGAIETGTGLIGASFREFPAESREIVETLDQRLKTVGLGSFLRIGQIGQALLEIPVSEGWIGAIVIGGLNPVAVIEETGLRVSSRAMAGLLEFNKLFHYSELEERVRTHSSEK